MKTPWILDDMAIESMLYSLSHLLAPFPLNFLDPKTRSSACHIDSIGSVDNFAFNAKNYVGNDFFD